MIAASPASYQNAAGQAVATSVGEIENPNPKAGTNNNYTQDGYQSGCQCAGLQASGEADGREPVITGRFCCSMYWRRTEIGAPPTEPAK